MPNYAVLLVAIGFVHCIHSGDLERIKYNNDGLVADLGAGLWAQPIPVDWDKNGIPDLLVGAEDEYLYYEKNQIDSK